MEQNSTPPEADGTALFAGEACFDPIEGGIRGRVRGFIEELLEQELTQARGPALALKAPARARQRPPILAEVQRPPETVRIVPVT